MAANADPDSKLLKAGAWAPEFSLFASPKEKLSLKSLKGCAAILAFYPADWSAVCGDQMALYNEVQPEFKRLKANVVGISVDGVWCHKAFAESRRLHFPLLADFEPKGAIARAYGAYRDEDGTAERALFVIDPDGVIHWSYVSSIDINPGADGILEALESLQTKKELRR